MSLVGSATFGALFYVAMLADSLPSMRRIAVLGVTPDLALVLLCVYGSARGATRATLVGFVTGLLQDSIEPGALGGRALVGAVTGYLAGRLGVRIFKRQIRTQILFTTIMVALGHWIGFMIESEWDVAPLLSTSVLRALAHGAYAGLVAPAIFVVGLACLERSRRLHAR